MIAELPPLLNDILGRARTAAGSVDSLFDGTSVAAVEDRLHAAAAAAEDRERRHAINHVLAEFHKYFASSPAVHREGRAIVMDNRSFATLTLVPPAAGGRALALAEVQAAVEAAGVVHGVRHHILEAAFERGVRRGGLIYHLRFAEATPPQRPVAPGMQTVVAAFDKTALFDGDQPFGRQLPKDVPGVAMGEIVAGLAGGSAGRPGTTVRGEEIPLPGGVPAVPKAGPGLRRSGDQWVAVAAGIPILQEGLLDVVPFYRVDGDWEPGEDIRFPGYIWVGGSVQGQVKIRCRDLYVGGALEEAEVEVDGDVYVQGRVVGKRTGAVRAGGHVFAHSVSDASVEAGGDVVVRDAIVYSDVASGGRIRVVSPQGSIFGGAVAALKEIRAARVGSDFASYTAASVGRDAASERLLARAAERIKHCEEVLAKIGQIKERLSEGTAKIRDLPGGRQDALIAVLKREAGAREELGAMRAVQQRAGAAPKEFTLATIKVVDHLTPPVKIEICGRSEEITRPMQHVALVLDRHNHVMGMELKE